MDHLLPIALDVVAVSVLVLAVYFPRHRRREMVMPYLAVNIGVMAVTLALSAGEVGAGLGLGLFGILSIIRLRSTELDQVEVAYYFVSLAMGLLASVVLEPAWLTPAVIVLLVVVVAVADSPRLLGRYRTQVVNLDHAYPDETQLRARLEQLLGARVHKVWVRRLDLVGDTTLVEVQYEIGRHQVHDVRAGVHGLDAAPA